MKILKFISLLFITLLVSACSSNKDAKLITFNVATLRGVDTGRAYKSVVMPITGTRLFVNTDIILYSGDIEKINVAENAMPMGGKIEGFYFTLNDRGIRKLTNATASNMGSYIVCSYNSNPIGLRIIDTVITDGRLFVPSEYYDAKKTIHEFVEEMTDELDKVNEMKRDL
ncbi:MAG: hypothetical protein E7035_00200 [Verrucomicrobiaceae bacterium]|nr:hypothetical protein [Verrucomicrobiaceae bacterium]